MGYGSIGNVSEDACPACSGVTSLSYPESAEAADWPADSESAPCPAADCPACPNCPQIVSDVAPSPSPSQRSEGSFLGGFVSGGLSVGGMVLIVVGCIQVNMDNHRSSSRELRAPV